MTTGLAPLLMLDHATSHMRDRQRAARGLVSPATTRRLRAARAAAARNR